MGDGWKIEKINPKHGEEQNLEQEFKMLSNSDKIIQVSNDIISDTTYGENSVGARINNISKNLE